MSNIEQILTFAMVLYVAYIQNSHLFYREMQKACKKNNGECINCSCWSCPRKQYKDEYIENKKNLEGS